MARSGSHRSPPWHQQILSLPCLSVCRCETRLGFSSFVVFFVLTRLPFYCLSLLIPICTIMCGGKHMSIYPRPFASLSTHTPPAVFAHWGESEACVCHVHACCAQCTWWVGSAPPHTDTPTQPTHLHRPTRLILPQNPPRLLLLLNEPHLLLFVHVCGCRWKGGDERRRPID